MIIKHKKKHYADNLTTPKYVFKKCQKIWGVKCNIDCCATKKNKKCRRFISKKQNFLKQFHFKKTDILWGNFPHSKNKQFVEHAYYLWCNIGCRFLLLLPINTLTSIYAKKFILPNVEISKKIILTGRIAFLNPYTLRPTRQNSVNGYVTIFFNKRKKK